MKKSDKSQPLKAARQSASKLPKGRNFDFTIEKGDAKPIYIVETLDEDMGGWTAARCM
ncbi:hypothetical protein HX815_28575 [Pseudomonas sp. E6002]|uniref:hypothetical protein n=1 Tax=Pseudomonas sp. E6002 TaxID=2738820 RepID=UPI0015A251C1|nr:hypothetical protein [Pseudomonas sp. E6002]NWB44288.1 hypothetical protein [Pseudomonas sp. E6002]